MNNNLRKIVKGIHENFTRDKRFKQLANGQTEEKLKQLPGPGQYEGAAQWDKRSYNLRFIGE